MNSALSHPTLSSSQKVPNPHYQAVGGDAGVRRLVERFYFHLDTREDVAELRALHGDNLAPVKERLIRFLTEWMGGPKNYTEPGPDGGRGKPRLRKKHLQFSIGPRDADAWMRCMAAALREVVTDVVVLEELEAAFHASAQFLRNDPAHQHEPQGDSEGRASVVFYEKPGCKNNTRQKAWLEEAGHEVEARNLLTHPWNAAELTAFFGPLPVAEWFNRTAPAVKSGEVVPEKLDRAAALDLLLSEPLLIRRPLIECVGHRMVGFDVEAVHRWIGLPEHVVREQQGQNAEACLKA